MTPIYRLHVRDTPHLVWRVYRKMGGQVTDETEQTALAAFPELTSEDLIAVVKTMRAYIQSIDRDETTGRLILPKDKLVHGRYYKGRCRNATIARWNAVEKCFYHWRVKFDAVFLETIKYPSDEYLLFDVFNPVAELSTPKFEIPFERRRGAKFAGNKDDLSEFEKEMWSKAIG